jgi:hypothetical protein
MTGPTPEAGTFGGTKFSWLEGTNAPSQVAETLTATVQPDWAKDVFAGTAKITVQEGGGAWLPASPTPSGSPSPDLEDSKHVVSETYKPNGS